MSYQPFPIIPAWTPHAAEVRYPSTSTYNVCDSPYLGGAIGLDPTVAQARGVVTFRWTVDAAGLFNCGVQGMHLTSAIPSMAELRILNRGPFVYFTFKPFAGTCPLAATLFGTTVGGTQPLLCADTILFEQVDRPMAAATLVAGKVVPVLEPVYPADYFAGEVDIWFAAPAGVKMTLQEANLTDDFRIAREYTPGFYRSIVPMGTWVFVVNNSTLAPITYSLIVTQLITL